MNSWTKRIAALMLTVMLLSAAAPALAAWWWPFGHDEAVPAAATEGAALTGDEEPDPSAPAALPMPEPAESIEQTQTNESALIRVLLKSLGQPQALGLTLVGSYSVENDAGFRFADHTEVSVAADRDDLLLSVGGLTINMGSGFTLTRHAVSGDSPSGVMIHETEREYLYCGDISFLNQDGWIRAIVTLDIEDYLYGVVPYEMSDSFPLEALKAQAVAARTYAMSRKSAKRDYDVVDTTGDQVYRGLNPETENTFTAVDETRGVVGRYGDGYATCYFTASNGGQTELPEHIWGSDGDFGYFDVRDDPYDLENPSSPVKTLVLPADPDQLDSHLLAALKGSLTEQMSAMGYSDEVEDIRILSILSMESAQPRFGEGNRMYQSLRVGMQVEGRKLYAAFPTPDENTPLLNIRETAAQTLYGTVDFYADLKKNYDMGLNASDWEILTVTPMKGENACLPDEVPDSYLLESRRFGHGVGMSQRGAQQMAGQYGAEWTQILHFYYPGMTLVRMDYAREPLRSLGDLPKAVGYARVRATPAPTPAPLPALRAGERYAVVSLDSKASALNVREQPNTSSGIAGTLSNGQRLIIVADAQPGWAKIRTAELEGYCSTDYLTSE